MGSAFALNEYRIRLFLSSTKGESDVWISEPTTKGTFLYSVITPAICVFGICGNILSLLVLRRKELKASVYTYLSVLAFTDLCGAIVLSISGLARGALWWTRYWPCFDALILLPLGGVFSCISVMATMCVTADRILFLWNPCQSHKPHFCNPILARKLMACSAFAAIGFNLPYCFIYEWDDSEDTQLVTTSFFDSPLYAVHNWLRFMLFGVVPAIYLIIGNGFLILSIRKAGKIKSEVTKIRKKDHTNLTITLVTIVFFFIIGEIPTQLVSRQTAVTFLFDGVQSKADDSKALEVFRQLTTVLSAVNLSVNFVLYSLFCPPFCRTLRMVLSRKRKSRGTLQVNIFVLSKVYGGRKRAFSADVNVCLEARPSDLKDFDDSGGMASSTTDGKGNGVTNTADTCQETCTTK